MLRHLLVGPHMEAQPGDRSRGYDLRVEPQVAHDTGPDGIVAAPSARGIPEERCAGPLNVRWFMVRAELERR